MSAPTKPTAAAILRELHRLRRHCKSLTDEIERLPRMFKTQQQKLALQEKAQKQAQDQITKLKVAVKEKELKLKSNHEQIAKWEKQRNEVTSKKEYDALQVEIAHAKEGCEKIENEILATMEETDKLNARLPEIAAAVKQAKQELDSWDKTAKERQAALTEEMQKVQPELKTVEATLPEDIKSHYERLVGAMGEDAMSAVQERNCTACYTSITAQMYNNLLQGFFVPCKNCGRILYLPE
jgi:uncharacterized protein